MDDKPTHKIKSDSSNEKNPGGPQPHSRRAFLKGIGAAGVAAPFVAIATKAAARGPKIPDVLSDTHSSQLDLNSRPKEAYDRRVGAAKEDRRIKVPDHPNNGDEALYPTGIANFTKGFAHNTFGEVDPTVYARLPGGGEYR